MSERIECPSCDSPLRIPDDPEVPSYLCPRCRAEIPNPLCRRIGDRPERAPRVNFREEDRERDQSRPEGFDVGIVGTVVGAVTLLVAVVGMLALRFDWTGEVNPTMTARKHLAGTWLLVGLALFGGVTVAAVLTGYSRPRRPWRVVSMVLSIVGAIAVMLLVGWSFLMFFVASCFEPCDKKNQPPPAKQVGNGN